jgi:hypothetical protein
MFIFRPSRLFVNFFACFNFHVWMWISENTCYVTGDLYFVHFPRKIVHTFSYFFIAIYTFYFIAIYKKRNISTMVRLLFLPRYAKLSIYLSIASQYEYYTQIYTFNKQSSAVEMCNQNV